MRLTAITLNDSKPRYLQQIFIVFPLRVRGSTVTSMHMRVTLIPYIKCEGQEE